MTLKIAARKCLVWERCSSGGSASGAQASLLVRCRSCPEQQDQACATMSPLLGSTSSDCKTTSYSGFLFLRMTGPKAFFFFFFNYSKCGGSSEILKKSIYNGLAELRKSGAFLTTRSWGWDEHLGLELPRTLAREMDGALGHRYPSLPCPQRCGKPSMTPIPAGFKETLWY